MKRIAWTNDIHLNFLGTTQIETWLQSIRQQDLDGLVIAGDIGEAPSLKDYLIRLHDTLQIPIYYVLGNHDYYHQSIASIHQQMAQLHRQFPLLYWLNDIETPIALSERVALVGHEGWGDGQYGSYVTSSLMLHDYVFIQELASITPEERLYRLKALGDMGAKHLKKVLPRALATYDTVYIVMHAPPFQETCYHQGQSATDDNPYLPHFTCKAHGDVLLTMASQYVDKELVVLCGHTHGGCDVMIRPNLRVLCGEAVYGQPAIQGILTL